MSNKPIIVITRPNRIIDFTRLFFRLSLAMVGAKAVFVTPKTCNRMDDYISDYTGLILSGGSDIEPSRYGEPLDDIVKYNVNRDNFEFEMLKQALKGGKPILGICRGMQLINIHCGGTLFTDLKKLHDNLYLPQSFWAKAFYRKTVYAKGTSFLNIKGDVQPLRVNSIHHQSINKLGKGLKIVAKDDHEIVQAIEDKSNKIFGVQWHAEFLFYNRRQREIFRVLLNDDL